MRRFLLAVCAIAFLYNSTWAESPPKRSPGTTVQLPTFGIAIDAEGVLRVKKFEDPTGELNRARVAAAHNNLPVDVMTKSAMRKVSLVGLEKAIAARLAAGKQPDDVMRHLAGLTRIEYVFCYPDRKDIILVGPAEGWIEDGSGRSIGISGKGPTLKLADIVVALRVFAPGKNPPQLVGCTINPTSEALAKLRAFQSTIPKKIPQRRRDAVAREIQKGLRDSLGNSKAVVFGVPAETSFANDLLEADYRMKLIGVGLEPAPVKMTTFVSALRSARHSVLQRWWFTPNYDCVRLSADRLAMRIVGQGVQLLAEDKLIEVAGGLKSTGAKPNRASEFFTIAFTKKYEAISRRRPIFAQLRNKIDMLVAAAYLKRIGAHKQCKWKMTVFSDENQLPVRNESAAKRVPAVVNSGWKNNQFLAIAGGGVSIRPELAFSARHLGVDGTGALTRLRDKSTSDNARQWWWD